MFTIEQRKRLFAQQLLAEPQAKFKAGLAAWPDDSRQGVLIAEEWADDPEVHRYCREMIASGTSTSVPSKEQLVREILDVGRSGASETVDRLKAYELAAKMMGYIQPPQQNVDNRRLVVNSRVMVVRDHGNLEQWERGAKEQQKRLIEGHAERNPTQH